MDPLEITEKERLSRKDAAARLRGLADALAKKNDVEFESGALNLKVRVPDEVDFKLEFEINDDEVELEVELKWRPDPAPAPAPTPPRPRAARRPRAKKAARRSPASGAKKRPARKSPASGSLERRLISRRQQRPSASRTRGRRAETRGPARATGR